MNKKVLLIFIIPIAELIILGIILGITPANNSTDTNAGMKYLGELEAQNVRQVENNIREEKTHNTIEIPTTEIETTTTEPVEPATVVDETTEDESKTNEDKPVIPILPTADEPDSELTDNGSYIPYYVNWEKAEENAKNYEDGTLSLSELFQNSLLVGDSIVTGFDDFKLANKGNVIATVGAFLNPHLDQNLDRIVGFNPQILVLHYGINEISENDNDLNAFIDRYKKDLLNLKEQLPGTKIIVVGLMPVQNCAIQRESRFGRFNVYNKALHQMCEEISVGYYENQKLFYSNSNLYTVDGIHVQRPLYLIWMKDFIREMGLD